VLPKIGHIVFHQKLAEICLKVHQKQFTNYVGSTEVVQLNPADHSEILAAAKKLEEKCDIIISREDTVDFLEPHLSIQVIGRSIAFSDVLDALKTASRKGRQIALICYHNQDYDLSDWPGILGIDVVKFFYSSRKDVSRAVLEAMNHNVDVIVGGTLVAHHAAKLGVSHELLAIKEDTIIQTVRKALDVLRATKKERELTVKFQSLLDFVHEGIIFLDNKHFITYANNKACEVFEATKQKLLNINLFQILGEMIPPANINSLKQAIANQNNDPQLGLVFQFKEKSFIASIAHFSFENYTSGTMVTFTEASHLQKMEWNLRKQLSKKGLTPRFSFDDIQGKSLSLLHSKEEARTFARTHSTVLIFGETGTGKELFAQSIHRASPRADGPFVAINCSALPKDLMESELFGYDEGAFTGAKKTGKSGLFELAHGGTLFLDEIGTMPLDVQIKLLRVIQEKEITRLGGTKVIPIDVRIITATNDDLKEAVEKGAFRADLYYRLNVLFLRIPPLRERPEDISVLFTFFVKKFSVQLNANIDIPDPRIIKMLTDYHWPGNVRELEYFAERFVALATIEHNTTKLLEDLLNNIKIGITSVSSMPKYKISSKAADISLAEARNRTERELLISTGEEVQWNRKKMAQLLGISQATLWRKIKKAGLR